MWNVAWVVLMVGCGGPDDMPDGEVGLDAGIDTAIDTGIDPGCHWDCFGRYACEEGTVVRYAHAPVPCAEWTGRCPLYPGNADVCVDGCVEGASGPTPEALCNENQPHVVGDPCETDDDCQPSGSEPDGFGGTRPIVLRCDVPEGESSGMCVRVAPETCNAVDDDGDGEIDEDCAATPGLLGRGTLRGIGGRFVVASTRIGVVSGFAGEEFITVHDETGARVGEVEVDLTDFQDLATDGTDLLVLLYEHYASSAEILVLGDDGSVVRRIPLTDVPAVRYLHLRPFGGQWLLHSFEGPMSRHAAGGARIDGTGLEGWPDLDVAPIDGGLLAVATFSGVPYATRVPIPLTTVARPDTANLVNASRLVTLDDVILCAAWDPGARLVRFDAASGLELERRWVGELPVAERLPLTRAGDAAALSWRDGTVLRTLLLDASGNELGRTELDIPGLESGPLVGGEMVGGARVIATGASSFSVLAPADR